MPIVLDSGPLGLLSNPGKSEELRSIQEWAFRTTNQGATMVVPEVADYEVRRELIRAAKQNGIRRLDELTQGFA